MKEFIESIRQTKLAEANAEIARLRRQLAKKPNDGGDGEERDDADDEGQIGDELDPSDIDDHETPKKGKKKTKAKGDDVDKDKDPDEQPAKPTQRDPESPEEEPGDTTDRKDAAAYRARVEVSVAAIVAADAKRRGERPSPNRASGDSGDGDLYQRRVNALAATIVAVDKQRRGEIESPPPLPAKGTGARAILDAHYQAIGRKL